MAAPTTTTAAETKVKPLKGAERVGKLVNEWLDWREHMEDLEGLSDNQSVQQIAAARKKLAELRKTINSFIRGNTELATYAHKLGYTPAGRILGNEADERAGDNTKGDGTNRLAKDTSKVGTGGRGGRGGADDDLLPGKRGQDYHLIVDNDGNYAVLYTYKLPNGKRVKVAWDVDEKDFDKFHLDKSMARRLNSQQMDRIHFFGNAKDITRKNAGNMHPLKKFLKGLHEQFGGASWLRDKEYMSVVIMGHMEGWDKTTIANRLRRTKWYQSRTAFQRRWEQVYTDTDRAQEIKTWDSTVREFIKEAFGKDVDWKQYINEEELNRWVRRIASGRWGDPTDGWNRLQYKILNIAKKVEGTTAAFEEVQEEEQRRAWENEPELVFEELRKDVIYNLGYKHKLDNGTLRAWAEDIARERKSMGDWAQYLRKLKKNLLPYLDPDEAWQDRASTYKNIAEELLGRNISWNDKLLADLTKKDKDGAPLQNGSVAIDAWEFEKMVRNDNRFFQTKTYQDESHGLLNFLNETFNGVTGGAFPSTLG